MPLLSRPTIAFAILIFAFTSSDLLAEDANPADSERSKVVGRQPDGRRTAYESLSTKDKPLVGFEFGIARKSPFVQVSAFRPIFKDAADGKAAGLFEDATENGRPVKTPVHTKVKVVAKDGYAVAKVVVQYGLWIDSIQVHFAKINGDALDLSDTYKGESYGSTEAKGAYTTLDSEGRLVVGVIGTTERLAATGFGLVYFGKPTAPAKDAPKAPPPERVTPPQIQTRPPEGNKAMMKPLPNSGPVYRIPGLDPPADPAPRKTTPENAAPNTSAPTPSAPPPPARRADDPEARAKAERQQAEAAKKIEQANAEAQRRADEFAKKFKEMAKANQPRFTAPPAGGLNGPFSTLDPTEPGDENAVIAVFWEKCQEQLSRGDLKPEEREYLTKMQAGLELHPAGRAAARASFFRTLGTWFAVLCLVTATAAVARLLTRGPQTPRGPASDDTPSEQRVGGPVPADALRPVLAQLAEGEQLLWTGTPSPRVLWNGQVVLSAALGAGAVALSALAVVVAVQAKHVAVLGTVVPLVFFAGGAVLMAGVGLLNVGSRDPRGKVVYALTDRRAFVHRLPFFGEGRVLAFGPDEVWHLRRYEYARTENAGDLIFEHPDPQPGRKAPAPVGFLGIDNVRDVERLVRATLVDAPADEMLV